MFADPEKILRGFGVKETDIVADLGAGTGFYAIAAGRMARQGKVYAVEVIKDFLMTVKNKAKDAHLTNVECLWGDIEKLGGTKIKEGVADVVIASNVLFQVEKKEKFIEEARRILKSGGRLLLIDWLPGSYVNGTSADKLIPKEKARSMFEEKGFSYERDVDAGAHHYGMIFKKL